MEQKLEEMCFDFRKSLLEVGTAVRLLMEHSDFQGEQASAGMHGEMKANIMLAYRHIEDARMRLGKVVQAQDGGTSCYPK